MRKGDIILIAAIVVVLAASSAAIWYQRANQQGSLVAVVVSDGKEIARIDLMRVDEPYSFTVPYGEHDYNVVLVERGRIRTIEASCPDQIDVMTGWISEPGTAIICLPNKLVIYIEAVEE